MRVLLVTGVALALGSRASADVAADETLIKQGEELAKQGKLPEALVKFRSAIEVNPRAEYHCLIGLTYLRGLRPSEAEIELDLCRRGATPAAPAPDWLPTVDKQLARELENRVAIELVIAPDVAMITVPELFDGVSFRPPRAIHLTPGDHRIIAHGNRPDVEQTVHAVVGVPQTITVTLEPPPKPIPPRPRSRVPFYLIGGGVVAGAAGAVVQLALMAPARDAARDATFISDYNQHVSTFHTDRLIATSLYVVAATAIATGVTLRVRDHEAPISISGAITSGGGMVTLELHR